MYTADLKYLRYHYMTTDSHLPRYQRIEALLLQTVQPLVLSIEDESARHRVPPGAESHFKLIIVATQFIGLNRVARHRFITTLLQDELATGLHALSLALYTPEEWADHPQPIPSPPCQHKSSTTHDAE
jgi:BolA protein